MTYRRVRRFTVRKSLAAIGAVLLFASGAAAQSASRMELFLGYTYVRFDSLNGTPAFNMHGGSGQFVYNFDKWIGVLADLGAVHNGGAGGAGADTTIANYVFGPRLSWRHKRYNPYFQVLWGGVFAANSTRVR